MADAATFPSKPHNPWQHRRYGWLYIVAVVVVLLGLMAGAWYFGVHHASAPASTGTSNGSSQTTPSSGSGGSNASGGASGTTPQTYPVLVYFSKHPDSDNDPSLTFPVHRTATTVGVGSFAVTELLKGPTATEANRGYFTTVRLRDGASSCGGPDFLLSITNGTARLQFCKPFDHLGVVADGQADSELKATLKQFSSVQKVVILNSKGSCEFDLSGLNLCMQ